jgi:exonuclease VII small subunit
VGYKTEIEIGVRGAAQLDKLRKQVNDLNEKVNLIENSFDEGIQSIHRYDQALKTATDTLRKARIATDDEADAIKKYVTALGEANAAQDLQNRKLQQEITLRERAARIRQLPPTRATTQFAEPIGPQQASFLTGISSPVAGRIQNIKAAQAAMLAAEQQVDKTRKAFEAQFTQTQIKNDELVTQRKIALLDKETQRAIQNSKKENDAALKDFDQRLAARGRARQAQAAQGKRFESLALGAGFPLLFGGGAGQVLGGIAGSFVGSGFGGQILGSAIGGAVEQFLGSAAALGNALNVLNPDLDALVAAIGAVNTEEGERIKLLEELEGKTAALNAAQAELANLIGDDGVASLKEYSSDGHSKRSC